MLDLAPDADRLGQLRFPAEWRAQDFFRLFRDDEFEFGPAWGGEIRYFIQQEGEATPRQLVYPIFPAPGVTVQFRVEAGLDPLAPNDAARTFFAIGDDAAALAALGSDFARTTLGKPVRLVAEPGVRFYLGRRVATTAGREADAYLATAGRFRIALAGGGRDRMMCGFTSQE
jgi:hypothetical protein